MGPVVVGRSASRIGRRSVLPQPVATSRREQKTRMSAFRIRWRVHLGKAVVARSTRWADGENTIRVLSSAALFAQLCAFADHAPLERRVYDGEGHGSVVPAYLNDLTAWLEARVAGESATDQYGA